MKSSAGSCIYRVQLGQRRLNDESWRSAPRRLNPRYPHGKSTGVRKRLSALGVKGRAVAAWSSISPGPAPSEPECSLPIHEQNFARAPRQPAFGLDVRDSSRNEYRSDLRSVNPFGFRRYCEADSWQPACPRKRRAVLRHATNSSLILILLRRIKS
jgi:hypothetical protein